MKVTFGFPCGTSITLIDLPENTDLDGIVRGECADTGETVAVAGYTADFLDIELY